MKTIPLSDVTLFVRNGASIKQSKITHDGYPITRIETLSNGIFNYDKMGFASIKDDKYKDFYLKNNDVLLSHINSEKFLGRSVLYINHGEGPIIHGMNLLNIRFDQQKYTPSFFVWYTKSAKAKNFFRENTKHAVNQASIASSAIKSMPVPDVPLDYQETISNSLNQIEKTIHSKQNLLCSLDSLVKSLFNEMFGDPEANSKNFEVGKINDIGKCVAGATPSTSVKEYWENGTIPWLSSGEVNKGHIYETDSFITQLGYDNASTKLVPAHTVVLAMAGQGKTRGTPAIAEIELCTNQSICSIVNNEKVNAEYLYHYLLTQYGNLRSSSNGDGGRGGLNLKIIGNFRIIIPPIELQNEFADFVKLIDKSKFVVQKEIKDLQELLDSKMDEYFGGDEE